MLDVAIGILLLFLVSSLLASAVVETVGGFLHRRSKNLWDTIDLMLGRAELGDDGERLVDLLYRQPFVTALVRPTDRRYYEGPGGAPVRGAVAGGGELDDAQRKRRFYGPQHLPARDFADSLIEVLRPGGTADTAADDLLTDLDRLPDGTPLKTQLRAVVGAAGGTLAEVRAGIEGWYEGHMTAVSAWYRRQTRWFLFAAGMLMAVVLNIDAVHAATTLYRDEEVRAAVVEAAGQVAATECDSDDDGAIVACVRDEVGSSVELPIGWGADTDTSSGAWALRVVGWLGVAGSVTIGAPFWFDLLRRALALRGDRD